MSRTELIDRLNDTWGKVRSLQERCPEIKLELRDVLKAFEPVADELLKRINVGAGLPPFETRLNPPKQLRKTELELQEWL